MEWLLIKITLKAYAKLNLTLDITGILDNGYHSIDTIFQSVSLYDLVTVENGVKKTQVICGSDELDNQNNICFSAVKEYLMAGEIDDNIKVTIDKNIPLSAGLAGGSADAAAVLLALDIIYNHKVKTEKLFSIASSLGADVPFCMMGGTVKAEGIGDEMEKIKDCPDCDIILIKEGTKPSTKELYKRTDSITDIIHPNTHKAINAIENEDLATLANCLGNIFVYAWDENIENIKNELMALGALGAELSGSGPTVFGIFQKDTAEPIYNELKNKYNNVYLCSLKKMGAEIIEIE